MTPLPELTQVTASLWSKSPKAPGEVKLGVLEHLLNVAACAAEILELEPPHVKKQMAVDLGLEGTAGLAWVLALIALHDLGKASPAFQALWPEGQAGVSAKLEFQPALREPFTPHGVVTQAVLPDFLLKLGWNRKLAEQVADAVGCHHGFRVENLPGENLTEAQVGRGRWDQVRREVCRLVSLAVSADYAVVPTVSELSPAAFMRLAGLTSFADWLGSSFPLPTRTDFSAYQNPAVYFAGARAQARQLLREGVHWPEFAALHPEVPPLDQVFGYLTDGEFRPRPLQTALAAALAGVQGQTLVMVEAPMGEGKTEAALYAYLQLQQAAQHRGVYVALPTQATGSAMFGRLVQFLRKQGSKRPVSVQLAHGGTLLDDPFQKLLEETRVFYRSNVNAGDEDSLRAVRVEEWFTARKRALLDEFGVGTIDQALLGVLGVSHQFVRLWGLGNRVVVLDEVHAYDTYTSELIAALVAWLRALGSSVVIMSATLPDAGRRRLLEAWGAADAPQATYPRWTVAEAGRPVQAGTIPAVDDAGNASRPEKRLRLVAWPGAAQSVARQAVELAEQGGCVAVIVNTVGRAQLVQELVLEALKNRDIPVKTCTAGVPPGTDALGVLLYHARYPADERKYRENAVLKFLGKESRDRPRRLILIATQVAEQSLDFDADVMITDLAPVDLVLQRAGRLHRHERPLEVRFAHSQPALYVAGLDGWPEARMKAEFWDRVYEPALLYRTWRTLQGRESLSLPGELDDLVQEVYRGPYPDHGLGEDQLRAVGQAEDGLQSRRVGQQSKGMNAHIGLPHEFWNARLTHQPEPDTESVNDDAAAVGAPGNDLPRTRLGEQSVRLVPVIRDAEGCLIVYPPPKSVDRNWQRLPAQTATLSRDDMPTAQRIYRRSLSVSHWEVVASVQKGKLWDGSLGSKHRGWQAHPLLRDVWPLDLTAGFKDFGKLRVRLDPEQGLAYEPLS